MQRSFLTEGLRCVLGGEEERENILSSDLCVFNFLGKAADECVAEWTVGRRGLARTSHWQHVFESCTLSWSFFTLSASSHHDTLPYFSLKATESTNFGLNL